MPTIISGDGTITGLTATGISAVQNVGSANLPAGTVLQVVNASIDTTVSTTSTTYADTGLTVTITPKFSTSKILVLAQPNGLYSTAVTCSVNTRLVRNSTQLAIVDAIAGYSSASSSGVGGASISYLDSPATTSATTYKIQYSSSNGGTVYVNASAGSQSSSYITVMEIAS
jgi:hypothetical protein